LREASNIFNHLVYYFSWRASLSEGKPRGPGSADDYLTRLFHALSDSTRRRLLAQLTLGPAKVTDLARPFQMSLPAVSKHLRILERAGLVSRLVKGRVHRLSLSGKPLEQVEVWLDPFRSYWEQTLTGLQRDIDRYPPKRRRVDPGRAKLDTKGR
jgi:DNA-binding transcriptional ArsR family regulator